LIVYSFLYYIFIFIFLRSLSLFFFSSLHWMVDFAPGNRAARSFCLGWDFSANFPPVCFFDTFSDVVDFYSFFFKPTMWLCQYLRF